MLRSLFGWVKERSGRPTSDETASVDMRLEETRARSVAPALAQAIETRPEARFETRNVIGAGGMGTVVRVLDRNLGREVAMKIIAPERALDPGEGEAFVFEARVTAQLEHPNVIPVHDLGVDEEGRAYFVMRMVDGTTLQQRVQRPGDERPLEERLHELLLILLKVCDAVSFAHSRGVIHLDLKPQNIMTGPFGEVYVLDWGVARWKAAAAPPPEPRAEGEQECVGTPAYMAPEQARGEAAALDERTDVFGLGAVLYYVLVGRAPFNADSADASLALARACRFQDPQEVAGGVLPTALCEIARRALSSDPARRYASVAEMRQALERSLRGGLGAVVRTFAPGAVIVAEGEPGDAAFIITRGRCRAYKTIGGVRHVLREMGPGEVFGEIAVILSEPRTATVEALDDVTVQVVGREELEKGLEFHPWLGKIVHALTERFRDVDARLTREEKP